MNRLSVIIPSKTFANLKPCIRALRAAGENCRIIVVDDGIEWEESIPNISVAAGDKPFIFARNCNIGIRAAGEDDVVLLNDDALLKSQGGFSILQKAAEEHREYGCIGAVTNVTGQALQRPRKVGLRDVHHIAFVCVLIPRRTIEKIGPLDERYCLDYGVEDRDYCEMITRAGMKVGVHDSCYVDHGSLTSTFRGNPRTPGKSHKNRELFKNKFNLPSYWNFPR